MLDLEEINAQDVFIGICQKCGDEAVEIDYCEGFQEGKPWEICCYACGWFVSRRFESETDAMDYFKEFAAKDATR